MRIPRPPSKYFLRPSSRGRPLITAEDHHIAGGFGSAVLEMASAHGLNAGKIRVLGAPRKFIRHDARKVQLMEAGVTADELVKTAKEMLVDRGGKRRRK